MIPVVKPFLPPLAEYMAKLETIWESGTLTHNGPYVRELEKECKRALKLRQSEFLAVSNGTTAIQLALKALGLKGRIITSAFSWIATISAITWEGCTPVFADIDPDTYNIDPDEVRKLISADTVAILPVHTFGNPCDVLTLEDISNEFRIPIIYDAAHALGSNFRGGSVLEFGTASALSLHATKILNTGEGGAVVTRNLQLAEKIRRLRFFGYDEMKEITDFGGNFKMSEINAALGVSMMPYFREILEKRKLISDRYTRNLEQFGCSIELQKPFDCGFNRAYFSVAFKSNKELLRVLSRLEAEGIMGRRYFYPSLNTVYPEYHRECKLSESLSSRIACLPLYFDIQAETVDRICDLVVDTIQT
jgi:dTDP-4-amino-4,6-dideoxygalactose transaminase